MDKSEFILTTCKHYLQVQVKGKRVVKDYLITEIDEFNEKAIAFLLNREIQK